MSRRRRRKPVSGDEDEDELMVDASHDSDVNPAAPSASSISSRTRQSSAKKRRPSGSGAAGARRSKRHKRAKEEDEEDDDGSDTEASGSDESDDEDGDVKMRDRAVKMGEDGGDDDDDVVMVDDPWKEHVKNVRRMHEVCEVFPQLLERRFRTGKDTMAIRAWATHQARLCKLLDDLQQPQRAVIALVGRPGAGKSYAINQLVGREIVTMGVAAGGGLTKVPWLVQHTSAKRVTYTLVLVSAETFAQRAKTWIRMDDEEDKKHEQPGQMVVPVAHEQRSKFATLYHELKDKLETAGALRPQPSEKAMHQLLTEHVFGDLFDTNSDNKAGLSREPMREPPEVAYMVSHVLVEARLDALCLGEDQVALMDLPGMPDKSPNPHVRALLREYVRHACANQRIAAVGLVLRDRSVSLDDLKALVDAGVFDRSLRADEWGNVSPLPGFVELRPQTTESLAQLAALDDEARRGRGRDLFNRSGLRVNSAFNKHDKFLLRAALQAAFELDLGVALNVDADQARNDPRTPLAKIEDEPNLVAQLRETLLETIKTARRVVVPRDGVLDVDDALGVKSNFDARLALRSHVLAASRKHMVYTGREARFIVIGLLSKLQQSYRGSLAAVKSHHSSKKAKSMTLERAVMLAQRMCDQLPAADALMEYAVARFDEASEQLTPEKHDIAEAIQLLFQALKRLPSFVAKTAREYYASVVENLNTIDADDALTEQVKVDYVRQLEAEGSVVLLSVLQESGLDLVNHEDASQADGDMGVGGGGSGSSSAPYSDDHSTSLAEKLDTSAWGVEYYYRTFLSECPTSCGLVLSGNCTDVAVVIRHLLEQGCPRQLIDSEGRDRTPYTLLSQYAAAAAEFLKQLPKQLRNHVAVHESDSEEEQPTTTPDAKTVETYLRKLKRETSSSSRSSGDGSASGVRDWIPTTAPFRHVSRFEATNSAHLLPTGQHTYTTLAEAAKQKLWTRGAVVADFDGPDGSGVPLLQLWPLERDQPIVEEQVDKLVVPRHTRLHDCEPVVLALTLNRADHKLQLRGASAALAHVRARIEEIATGSPGDPETMAPIFAVSRAFVSPDAPESGAFAKPLLYLDVFAKLAHAYSSASAAPTTSSSSSSAAAAAPAASSSSSSAAAAAAAAGAAAPDAKWAGRGPPLKTFMMVLIPRAQLAWFRKVWYPKDNLSYRKTVCYVVVDDAFRMGLGRLQTMAELLAHHFRAPFFHLMRDDLVLSELLPGSHQHVKHATALPRALTFNERIMHEELNRASTKKRREFFDTSNQATSIERQTVTMEAMQKGGAEAQRAFILLTGSDAQRNELVKSIVEDPTAYFRQYPDCPVTRKLRSFDVDVRRALMSCATMNTSMSGSSTYRTQTDRPERPTHKVNVARSELVTMHSDSLKVEGGVYCHVEPDYFWREPDTVEELLEKERVYLDGKSTLRVRSSKTTTNFRMPRADDKRRRLAREDVHTKWCFPDFWFNAQMVKRGRSGFMATVFTHRNVLNQREWFDRHGNKTSKPKGGKRGQRGSEEDVRFARA